MIFIYLFIALAPQHVLVADHPIQLSWSDAPLQYTQQNKQ